MNCEWLDNSCCEVKTRPTNLRTMEMRTHWKLLSVLGAVILGAGLFTSCSTRTPSAGPKKQTDLIAAIRRDDAEAFAQILSTNSLAIDAAVQVNGVTSLMIASSLGSERVAQWLLWHGANANAASTLEDPTRFPEEAGCTALLIASSRGRLNVAKLLVEHGADVNHRDHR